MVTRHSPEKHPLVRLADALIARVHRWHCERQTRDALMNASDRVLADIGIEREDIPLIARGIEPGTHRPREGALARRWYTLLSRVDDARAARRERRRIERELEAYSDRELDDIGIHRRDISIIARSAPDKAA